MNIYLKYLESMDFRDRHVKIPVIRRDIFVHHNTDFFFNLVRNMHQYISEVTDTCINWKHTKCERNWQNADFPSQHSLTSLDLIVKSGARWYTVKLSMQKVRHFRRCIAKDIKHPAWKRVTTIALVKLSLRRAKWRNIMEVYQHIWN